MSKRVTLIASGLVVAAALASALAPADEFDTLPADADRDLVIRTCAACHPPEVVVAKRHTEAEWDSIIAKMVDHGAVANEAEQVRILEYFLRHFGTTD
jgi:cytochrome c5